MYILKTEITDKCNLDMKGTYKNLEEVFEALRGVRTGAKFVNPNVPDFNINWDADYKSMSFTLKISPSQEYVFILTHSKGKKLF